MAAIGWARVAAVNENFAPMQFVDVECFDLDDFSVISVVRTDAAGIALFTGLPSDQKYFFRPRATRVSTKVGGKTFTGQVRIQIVDWGGLNSCYDAVVSADEMSGTYSTIQAAIDARATAAIINRPWYIAIMPKGGESGNAASYTYQENLSISSIYSYVLHGCGKSAPAQNVGDETHINRPNVSHAPGVRIQGPDSGERTLYALGSQQGYVELRGIHLLSSGHDDCVRTGGKDLKLIDCWVDQGAVIAILMALQSSAVITRCWIGNDETGEALSLGGGSMLIATNSKFQGLVQTGSTIVACELIATRCAFVANRAGPVIYIAAGGSTASHEQTIRLVNCQVQNLDSTANAIGVDVLGRPTGQLDQSFMFVTNQVLGNGDGIGFRLQADGGPTAGGTIVGNVFRDWDTGVEVGAQWTDVAVLANAYINVNTDMTGPNTISDDELDSAGIITTTTLPHVLLDGDVHTDTVAVGALGNAGSMVIGNDTPAWDELTISVPAANVLNVLGVANGETVPTWKTVLDATNPADTTTAADPGTSLIFSHRDHAHALHDHDHTGDPGDGGVPSIAGVLNEPTGFPNRADSVLSISTRTFTIGPSNGSFDYYQVGVKYTVESPDDIIISDVDGLHVIYYDGDTLSESVNPSHAAFDTLILDKVLVGLVYWNATDGASYILADERHGCNMSGQTHEWLHGIIGAVWCSGLTVSGYTVDEPDADASLTFEVTDGEIIDEDIEHEIEDGTPANQYEQQLNGGDAEIPVLYREGDPGHWTEDAASTLPWKTGGSGRLAYNSLAGSTYGQTEVTDGKWVSATLVATNDWLYPIKMIQGQAEYTDKKTAIEEATNEIIAFGNLPSPEMVILYRFVLQTKDSYGSTPNAQIVDVTDFRRSGLAGGAATAQDHGTLSGLGDDDHAQYLLADGTRELSGNWDAGGTYSILVDTIAESTGAAGVTIETVLLKDANVYVGVDDTTSGYLHLYGDAGGSAVGGTLRLHTAADHDAVFQFFDLTADEDDFEIQHNGGPDFRITDARVVEIINALKVDTIDEYTGAAGVTVENVLLKDGNVEIHSSAELRFYDNGNYVGFEAPALGGDQIWVLPDADAGTDGMVMKSNASGVLSWIDHGGLAGLGDDDHTQYLLKTLFDAQSIVSATSDNTPIVLAVAEQRLVGRLTGGDVAAITIGIADDNILQVDGSPNDDEFARFTANGLEGRTAAETRSDLNGADLDATPGSDHTSSGITSDLTAGENLVYGDFCYMKSDGKMWKGDADAIATSSVIGMANATIADGDPGSFLLWGFARDDTWTWTVGGLIFLSETAGAATQTSPSDTDDVIQILGVATHADRMLFKPELVQVEHTG